MTPHETTARWSRIARKTGRVLGWIVASIVLLVLAALLSLNLPPVRGVIAKQVTAGLAGTFRGRIVIRRIGSLGIDGVSGVDATVYDPAGRQVVAVDGLTLQADVVGIGKQALFSKGPLDLAIARIAVAHADVALFDDGSGSPTLASTFAPAHAGPPSAKPAPTIRIASIEFQHAWAHGGLQSLPVIDLELSGLDASLVKAPHATEVGLQGLHVRTRSLPRSINPGGGLKGRARLGEHADDIDAELSFDGTVASVATTARATLRHGTLHAHVAAPSASAAALEALAPGLSPSGPVEFMAEADGLLPDVDFRALVTGGMGSVSLTGHANVGETKVAAVAVTVNDFDAAGVVQSAPRTRVQMSADASARMASDGVVRAEYRVVVPAAPVGSHVTPAISFRGDLVDDPRRKLVRAEGSVDVAEPGARTKIDYAYRDVGAGGSVELSSTTDLRRPPRLAELAQGLSLSGQLDSRVRLEPANGTLSGNLTLDARDVRRQRDAIGRLLVTANVSGRLPNPRLSLELCAEKIQAQSRNFSRLRVSAHGEPTLIAVDGVLDGDQPKQTTLRGVVVLAPKLALHDVMVVATDAKGHVTLRAKTVRFADRLRLEDVEMEGAGTLRLSLTMGERLEQLNLATEGLDIPRLLGLAGVRSPLQAAKLTLSAEYVARGRRPTGQVHGTVDALRVDRIDGAQLKFDGTLANDLASAELDAGFGSGGHAHVAVTDLSVIEPPSARAALDRMSGKLEVRSDLDLGYLAALTHAEQFPFARMRGKVVFDLTAERRAGRRGVPDVLAHFATQSLALALKRKQEQPIRTENVARETQPWAIDGIDFGVDLDVDGSDGSIHGTARASDKAGELASVDLASRLPQQPLVKLVALGSRLGELPIDARARVPERALETLPALLRLPDTAGIVSVDARATGTISDPKVTLNGRVSHYRTADSRASGLDLAVDATYETERGEISGSARDGEGRGQLFARWDGPILSMGSALERAAQPSPIRGEARVELDRFRLEDIPVLGLRQIGGTATGEVRLDGFGRDAELDAGIRVADLRVAQAKPMQLETKLDARNNQLRGSVTIKQPDGSANGDMSAGYSWGNRIVPTVVMPVDARFASRRLQIAALLPLVHGSFSEIDGRLDADMTGHFGGGPPSLAGRVDLEHGVVRIPAIGQRFHDISARATLEHGQAHLAELTARGTTGKLKATASARFSGLALQNAEAHVSIAKRDKIPVTTEGVEVGDAWGEISTKVRIDERATRIDVDVPRFHIQLPQNASHQVQDLVPPDYIRTGVLRPDGNFVVVPVQPLEGSKSNSEHPTIITVTLRNDVWVERPNQARVQLAGEIKVTPDTPTQVNGQISLKGGTLDVQGKEFDVERGTVTFTGDSSNPEIVATAVWDSPSDYRVYAEYTGTIKNGKLTLRADPPLTQDQILSLILFGDPDGTAGTGSTDPAATAVGVAGSTATQGLNRMLANITQLDVSARIDTSSGSARPELVLRVTPRISARLSQALGEPAPGEPPDRTFLMLDARVGGRWAVDTTIGDKGASSVDLNWRLRY